jgi:antitoxin (DNA-binding transcriptional repressor) of toxin-antitoxin stability system
MKTVTISKFRSNLSYFSDLIQEGEEIVVTYGRKRKKIFRVLPFLEAKPQKRKLGALNGAVRVKFSKDFKMTAIDID